MATDRMGLLQVGFVSQLNLTGKSLAFLPIPLAHLFSVRWLDRSSPNPRCHNVGIRGLQLSVS